MSFVPFKKRYPIFQCSLFLAFCAASIPNNAAAQSSTDLKPQEPEPTITRIETYGLKRTSRESILKAAEINVGDSLRQTDQAEVIKRLEALPGIRKAAISGIYGRLLKDDQLGMVLYLGVDEAKASQPSFRSEPRLDRILPAEIVAVHDREQAAFARSATRGNFGEDRSQGHSLAADRDLRATQEQFIPLADEHWAALVDVLHNARDSTQRSVAAKVIAYSSNKSEAVRELSDAMHDPAPAVRNNATRALSLIFGYAKSHPELSISPSPRLVRQLVAMLHSVDWTDRNKAVSLLLEIDDSDEVINELRRSAIPSLVEMANWETVHGAMAFMLIGRLDGIPHDESHLIWRQGNQASVIARVLKGLP